MPCILRKITFNQLQSEIEAEGIYGNFMCCSVISKHCIPDTGANLEYPCKLYVSHSQQESSNFSHVGVAATAGKEIKDSHYFNSVNS